jgi:hypothetical protein
LTIVLSAAPLAPSASAWLRCLEAGFHVAPRLRERHFDHGFCFPLKKMKRNSIDRQANIQPFCAPLMAHFSPRCGLFCSLDQV